jgi:Na+-driven multidrug efflux pump
MSNVSMNLVGMLYNLQLLKYLGDNGIAAYGVMMYVGMIFAGTFIGYSIGSAPVISYHDGAKNYKELKNVLKKSLIIVGITGIIMIFLGIVFARPLAYIFVSYSNNLMDMTTSGFRIFAICFPFMGFAIYGSSFFTALNDGIISAIISFLRTLVFQIGAVLLLPLLWKENGIWASVVVAEIMAVVFTFIFMIAKRKKYHY